MANESCTLDFITGKQGVTFSSTVSGWKAPVCLGLGLIGLSLVGERIFPTGYCPIDRESEGLRFNVVIREDAKVSPFTDVIVKAALSTHLF